MRSIDFQIAPKTQITVTKEREDIHWCPLKRLEAIIPVFDPS